MIIIVTGGAGFIGSAVVRHLIKNTEHSVVNIDRLTYAANQESLAGICKSPRYFFERVDICDKRTVEAVFSKYKPDAVMHLAAESHVDRSIDGPEIFITTNIQGTFVLLQAALKFWASLKGQKAQSFRFHHVSTDEVFGDLAGSQGLFVETSPYLPSSPYSASKAASDHLVRAWGRTYGLPVIISNCSNNYGPCQFPEKLIPLMIINAIEGRELPIYGQGKQIRDWLFVNDHARALAIILSRGAVGETYNVGGCNEKENIEVVVSICDLLEELNPSSTLGVSSYHDLIRFVEDRPGHDLRYAIDASKLKGDLGWEPLETFDTGLRKTVKWYLNNGSWWRRIMDGSYRVKL